ncbi:Sorting nexin, cytoplasm-to-vacuole targeting pathway/endosomal sorting, partial [Coemansia sp. RSA 638]
MNRLTYALNGMMDVDPEQMRHNQIGRASDKISLLEDQLEMLSNDMALVNTSTQDNLDRFQKQKVCDLKGALIAMARMHLEWAEKNLEIWKEAKIAVDQPRIQMRFSAASLMFVMASCALSSPVFFGDSVFDPFTGSGSAVSGVGAVDGAGNSFLRVDQDTQIHGQNIVNLNQDSVTGQQGGPGIAADGAI